ncbi:PREDICTED: uncharacterized protein LOC109356652 [Lupinus angustifolius]|uniref:uncharacterized protein LOC109356652 n=1 Tax=Lupinus angustifolius TaxID=3871 RepID=UPI00092EF617|nr:PREDICTED: uncharacterized protein LOC109356652 [Lupinus angustifolius]
MENSNVAIMGFQEVSEIVEDGIPDLAYLTVEAQRVLYKESKKKYCKAIFLLHQCVYESHFKKISEMKSSERIAQIINRVISHTNAMKASGEKMTDQTIVEKILRSLDPKFDHIVVAIEESKKIEELKIMDLQGYGSRGVQISIGRERDQRRGGYKYSQFSDQERSNLDPNDFSTRRGGYQKWQGNKKKVDRKKLKCFNCDNIEHFSNECQVSSSQNENRGKHHNEAYLVKKESDECQDDEPVWLMMEINNGPSSNDKWYIESKCSNHVTGNRNWLINFDDQRKSSVRFAYSRTIQAEGTGDVLINRKDGRNVLISDVL